MTIEAKTQETKVMGEERVHTRGDISTMYTPEPNTGCWLWLLSGNGRGYGRVYSAGRTQQAHRVVYEMHRGPIPDGMVLDHKCRVTCCVNPDHLEPVPHIVNVRRGVGVGAAFGAIQKAKTHCPLGHEYAGGNLLMRGNGARLCRTCVNERNKRRPTKASRLESLKVQP